MTKQRCIAFGCENEKRQGTFVDDLCAPCYEALTTGIAKHGTSILFTQAREIERLQRARQPMVFEPVAAGSQCRNCGGYWIPMPGGTLYHECRIGGASDEPSSGPTA